MQKGSSDSGFTFAAIIILGLLVLFLGLFFVNKFFGFAEKESLKISANDILPDVSENNRIGFESEMSLAPGEKKAFIFNVYNKNWLSDDEISLFMDSCINSENLIEDGITLTSLPQRIEASQSSAFKAVIAADDAVKAGVYICMINAGVESQLNDAGSEQLVESAQISLTII